MSDTDDDCVCISCWERGSEEEIGPDSKPGTSRLAVTPSLLTLRTTMIDLLLSEGRWQKQDQHNRDQAARLAAILQCLLDNGAIDADKYEKNRLRFVGEIDQIQAAKADADNGDT